MRGKKPLSENHVKSLRKLVEGNELHELLLNLSVDLMLRGGDLLSLRVSDVLNESVTVKKEVRVKMKKTGQTTLKLHFKIHDIVLTNPRDTDEQDLYVTIERIGNCEEGSSGQDEEDREDHPQSSSFQKLYRCNQEIFGRKR